MIRTSTLAALLAGGAFIASPAAAQDAAAQPETQATEPDRSDATADATIRQATQVDDLQSKIELLQAQVEALQEALEGVKTQQAKVTPSWKGAPESADKDAGFTFKVRGAAQFDAGYVGYPDGDQRRGTVSGLNYQNLGFNARARRLLFGAEGTLPGGFRYSAEFNLAQGAVDYEDVFLAYDFKKTPLTIQVGNIYPFSSLESMTSSKATSFLERASFTDAFNYNRRLGVGLTLSDKKTDSYLVQAGVFSTPINDSSFTRTGWQASLRGVYSPTLGSTRLHIGANFQHRVNVQEAQAQQYRTRPLTQITDQRFIDTGNIASEGDDTVGVEFGAVRKGLHVAAEGQKVWVRNAFNQAQINAIIADQGDNDAFPTGAIALNGDPSFWGGYFELGYFLTGETRGYKGGKWDRTKVLKPFNEGGWGAFQINGRVDYVDLGDRVDNGSNLLTAPFYLNGGKQLGLQTSLIWTPIDWVRFMAQYGRVQVTGGPRALGLVDLDKPADKRKFSVDTAAIRAQVEF